MKKGEPHIEKVKISANELSMLATKEVYDIEKYESRKRISDPANAATIFCIEGQLILTVGNNSTLLYQGYKVVAPANYHINVKATIKSKYFITHEG